MFIRVLLLVALTSLMGVPARASLFYRLDFSQSSLALAAGQNAVVGIFFTETAVGSAHRIDLAGGTIGLTSASFRINTSGAGNSAITAAVGNGLFDLGGGPDVNVGPPTTIEQDTDILSDPVFATLETPVTGGTVRSVQVGTVTITASNTIGDVNVFSLADFGAGDQFVLDDGTAVTPFAADSVMAFGDLTVTAVPEPSSLVALAIAGGVGALRYRRRKSCPIATEPTV